MDPLEREKRWLDSRPYERYFCLKVVANIDPEENIPSTELVGGVVGTRALRGKVLGGRRWVVDEELDLSYMKPQDPKIKELLYSVYDSEARRTYLKARNKLSPEEKFDCIEVSSWVCGWQLDMKKVTGSKFGKQKIVEDSFYRRGDVRSDPFWYREPSKLSPNPCGLF